jgi:hypothetical protein
VTTLVAALALLAYRLSFALYPLYWARPSLIAGSPSVLVPEGAVGIVVSTGAALLGLLLAEVYLRRRILGRTLGEALTETDRTNAPACLLLPCLLLLAPGAPGVPPLAFWLALDARHFLASLALFGCLWLKLGERIVPRLPPAAAIALLALILVALTPRHRFTQPYDERFGTGDEPRYIRITASLLYDGDTDISNASDHLGRTLTTERVERRAEIRGEGEARSLGGQVVAGRLGGEYYVYLPGFPLLLVPLMAVDSMVAPHHLWAVMSFCILLGVVNVMCMAKLLEEWLPSGTGAFALAGALAVTPPLLAYAFQIYPEVAASICVTVAMMVILRGPAPPGRWQAASFAAATALLPWLHTKYYPLWGVILLGFLVRFRHLPKKRLALVLAAPALAVGLQSIYVFRIAGSFLPDALWVLNGYPRGAVLINEQTLSGLYYLFLGRSEGLLVYGPHYLLGLIGLAGLRKWNPFGFWLSLFLFAPYVLLAASHHPGGGGWSPPCRYWVPMIPVLALGFASWLRTRSPVRIGVLVVFLLASFWIGLGMLEERHFLYDREAFRASGAIDPSPILPAYPFLLAAAALLLHAFEAGWTRRLWLFPALAIVLVLAAGHLALRWSSPESWTPARPSMQGRLVRPSRSELILFRDCAEPSLRGLVRVAPAGEFVQWSTAERVEWKLLGARALEGSGAVRVEPVCP